QIHAFEVFTSGLARWWPKGHSIAKTPMKAMMLEPRLGGRWYEKSEDGTETLVGKVLAWEPPARFVISWNIDSQWKPDAAIASEVEVRFIPDGAGTRVELEHRKFEVMGEEGGAKMRKDVDGGWPGLLEIYRKNAET
ncbi:MAG: SRPBCC family protein, partial [Rhodospirillaceae bacterium]